MTDEPQRRHTAHDAVPQGGAHPGAPSDGMDRRMVVGLVAALIVLLVVGLASASWTAAALVALMAGVAGYALTPQGPEPTYANGVPRGGATAQKMTAHLRQIRTTVAQNDDRLPPASFPPLAQITSDLDQIIVRWSQLTALPDQRLTLESIVYHDLPRALEVFLVLPDREKPGYAAEWTDQVQLLARHVGSCRDALVRRDVAALRTQSELLEQRLGDGDLRLFREHGL